LWVIYASLKLTNKINYR